MILVGRVHARDHADAQGARTVRQCRRCGLKCRSRQSVSDDSQLLARQAGSCEACGRRLRIANHRVAPAKSDCLRAELRGSHQVSDLAMTADDHRHSRQTGCRDERKVGVKIESVGNLDATPAEMAAEVETGAQRLPSKKAVPHWKLVHFAELIGKRAAWVHAS